MAVEEGGGYDVGFVLRSRSISAHQPRKQTNRCLPFIFFPSGCSPLLRARRHPASRPLPFPGSALDHHHHDPRRPAHGTHRPVLVVAHHPAVVSALDFVFSSVQPSSNLLHAQTPAVAPALAPQVSSRFVASSLAPACLETIWFRSTAHALVDLRYLFAASVLSCVILRTLSDPDPFQNGSLLKPSCSPPSPVFFLFQSRPHLPPKPSLASLAPSNRPCSLPSYPRQH